MSHPSKQQVALYVVPTPIGNMGDITLRALEVLKSVDIIACEDTRVTGKLLSHYDISTRTLCYNDFSTQQNRNGLLKLLQQGNSIALVSDAGTPLISDPGYKLLKDVEKEGFTVTSLPGASSVLTGLTLSGLPTDRFMFVGFLPAKQAARITTLHELKDIQTTLVFFEAARRLIPSLKDMTSTLGNRPAAVLREMTKTYEEIQRGTLDQLVTHYNDAEEPRGEIVIAIGPPQNTESSADELDTQLKKALKTMSVKEAADMVTQTSGIKRKQVYTRALELAGKKQT